MREILFWVKSDNIYQTWFLVCCCEPLIKLLMYSFQCGGSKNENCGQVRRVILIHRALCCSA